MKRYIKRWISFILFMCVFVQYPSEGVVMAADSDQKNIQIVGTASMNTYDVALRVGKTKQLVWNDRKDGVEVIQSEGCNSR